MTDCVDKGKISIVVPVYRVEDYLERCIGSLMSQTYEDIEIILVDDESPDKCPAICDEYGRKDSRIRVIHKKHEGLSAARNTGIAAAEGDYVMFVDSDDYIEFDSCERLVSSMDADVDIVAGASRKTDGERTKYLRHSSLVTGRKYTSREFVEKSIENNEWYVPSVLNLYRKDFLLDNSLYFKTGYSYEDFQMLPRLFLAARTVVYVDYPFYNYCVRPGSIMTSGYTEEQKRMCIENCEDWMNLLRTVEDEEYRKLLYGFLIRSYLVSARRMEIRGWKANGMDYPFVLRNALNAVERVKVSFFSFFPGFYRIGAGLIRREM